MQVSDTNGTVPRMFRSADAGATWSAVRMPASPLAQYLLGSQGGTMLQTMSYSPYVKGLVYAPVFVGTSSAALLRSKDAGQSWELLSYFDPKAPGVDYRSAAAWLVTTRPDGDGAVTVFLPGTNGFSRFVDRTALK